MCHGNEKINSKEWRIMKCCGHLFLPQSISGITNTTGLCPACDHNVPPTVVNTMRNNDIVREDPVKKRKQGQIHQGEKKKKHMLTLSNKALQMQLKHQLLLSLLIDELHPMPVEF